MTIPSSLVFSCPKGAQFKAVRFESTGSPIYVGIDHQATIDIYRNSSKVQNLSFSGNGGSKLLNLSRGVYYAVIYDVKKSNYTRPESGNGNEDFVKLRLMLEDNKPPKPVITYNELLQQIEISCIDKEAVIYYTLDKLAPTSESNVYEKPITVEHNVIVKAVAVVEGIDDSDITTLEVNSFIVPVPDILRDGNSIEFKCPMENTDIWYTLDGSSPKNEITRILYDGNPLVLTSQATIQTYSTRQDFTDSEIVRYDFIPICSKPVLKDYDGRYLSIDADPEATICYSLDDINPLGNGIRLEITHGSLPSIDLEGLSQVRIICIRDGFNPSEELTFTPEYYSNDSVLFTTKPHQVADAFGWTDDFSAINTLEVHGTLNAGSMDDSADYEWLMHLPNLAHLDLGGVTDRILPNHALDSDKLIYVALPAYLISAGENIFGSENTTLCAFMHSSSYVAPSSLLKGVNNPNLIGYFTEKRNAASLRGELRNVIYGESLRADSILLDHGHPLYVPKKFMSDFISYKRNFGKETSIGDFGSGWETMCVPFNVQNVRSGNTYLEPFAVENRNGKPYWLYKANGIEWEITDKILSNEPYLIAMPNNPRYEDDYNVTDIVYFEANNVEVAANRDEYMPVGMGGGNYIHVNYDGVSTSDNILALNQTDEFYNVTYRPGGIFVRGLRDVPPFECYVTTSGSARYVKIFGDTDGIDTLDSIYSSLRIWKEAGNLCLSSEIAMEVPVYDTLGRLVRVIEVAPGISTVISLTPGIYIINSHKIIL